MDHPHPLADPVPNRAEPKLQHFSASYASHAAAKRGSK